MTAAPTLVELMHWWSDSKDALEAASPVGNHLIHLAVGLAMWAAIASLVRRRPLLAAWLATAAVALLNEAIDLAVERWPNLAEQLAQGAADLAWTLALPTLLTIAGLLRSPRVRHCEEEQAA
jgi:diacylglycerol kinase